MRLKAIRNIEKITKSMKMVSAAKYTQAERKLKHVRPYGIGALEFYDKCEVKSKSEDPNQLIIAVTSDRGLCGSVHSSIVKPIVKAVNERLDKNMNVKIVCIGDKASAILSKKFPKSMLYQFNQIGRVSPTFTDASIISQHIISSNVVFDHVEIYYNKFKSVIQHNMNIINIYNIKQIMESSQYGLYDSLDESVLLNYNEFLLASIIYYVLAQGNCSEQSSRMTAMENASKNAREMIKDFELLFNRTRQRVITNELIEIISGASAIEDA